MSRVARRRSPGECYCATATQRYYFLLLIMKLLFLLLVCVAELHSTYTVLTCSLRCLVSGVLVPLVPWTLCILHPACSLDRTPVPST